MRPQERDSRFDPGCVKTLRGIIAPGIFGPMVMRRAKKRKNLSSARHYDQIRFRFYTTKILSGPDLSETIYEAPAEGSYRHDSARTRLQSLARDQYYRRSATP